MEIVHVRHVSASVRGHRGHVHPPAQETLVDAFAIDLSHATTRMKGQSQSMRAVGAGTDLRNSRNEEGGEGEDTGTRVGIPEAICRLGRVEARQLRWRELVWGGLSVNVKGAVLFPHPLGASILSEDSISAVPSSAKGESRKEEEEEEACPAVEGGAEGVSGKWEKVVECERSSRAAAVDNADNRVIVKIGTVDAAECMAHSPRRQHSKGVNMTILCEVDLHMRSARGDGEGGGGGRFAVEDHAEESLTYSREAVGCEFNVQWDEYGYCVCATMIEATDLAASGKGEQGGGGGAVRGGGPSASMAAVQLPLIGDRLPSMMEEEDDDEEGWGGSTTRGRRGEDDASANSNPGGSVLERAAAMGNRRSRKDDGGGARGAVGKVRLSVDVSVGVSSVGILCWCAGLLLLACAEPLSRVHAMHIVFGGLSAAGIAHMLSMVAIAAVPGVVVALPWVAALSVYRLGLFEALAMLVACYVYMFAMALVLLYLYTTHFNYIQALYLFVVINAAVDGALRAEASSSAVDTAGNGGSSGGGGSISAATDAIGRAVDQIAQEDGGSTAGGIFAGFFGEGNWLFGHLFSFGGGGGGGGGGDGGRGGGDPGGGFASGGEWAETLISSLPYFGAGAGGTATTGTMSVLKRSVFLTFLVGGVTLLLTTTNVNLYAIVARSHVSHLPVWMALFLASSPALLLAGLEIHCRLLSCTLIAFTGLPGLILQLGSDGLDWLRGRLGFIIPGHMRHGASRYNMRSLRRVFYSHVLEEEESGETGRRTRRWGHDGERCQSQSRGGFRNCALAWRLLGVGGSSSKRKRMPSCFVFLRKFQRWCLYLVAGVDPPVEGEPLRTRIGRSLESWWKVHVNSNSRHASARRRRHVSHPREATTGGGSSFSSAMHQHDDDDDEDSFSSDPTWNLSMVEEEEGEEQSGGTGRGCNRGYGAAGAGSSMSRGSGRGEEEEEEGVGPSTCRMLQGGRGRRELTIGGGGRSQSVGTTTRIYSGRGARGGMGDVYDTACSSRLIDGSGGSCEKSDEGFNNDDHDDNAEQDDEDDRRYYEYVTDEDDGSDQAGERAQEWDWMVAEGLTPGYHSGFAMVVHGWVIVRCIWALFSERREVVKVLMNNQMVVVNANSSCYHHHRCISLIGLSTGIRKNSLKHGYQEE
ncbi:hypothetical protein CBR_g23773 [Chara braunii]|uniref:Uncharacterized protein n=1 Tax=Chara braunii TaxID=69332 RepID=A0A388JVK6_CHABU|nr:hypothetical protein CBR_g23773 [Chara braunii]|eukprot:GBG61815.1 hypothetical protein CBR_g23773 [Chara braunii]